MHKTMLIIQREFLSRVKKRSFMVMTILGPLLFALFMAGAIYVGQKSAETHEVLIVDYHGIVSAYGPNKRIESRFPARFRDAEHIRYHFDKERLDLPVFQESPYTLMIELDDFSIHDGKIKYYYKKVPSTAVQKAIEDEFQSAIEEFTVRDSLKMDWQTYQRIKKKVRLIGTGVEQLEAAETMRERAIVGITFSVVIYFFIFMYGVQVMRGVIEEKSNRIIEVLVSSVRPFQLMLGKIIGIGLVGLTQFALWIVLSFTVYLAAESIYAGQSIHPSVVIENAQTTHASFDVSQGTMHWQEIPMINAIQRINWAFMLVVFSCFFIGGYLLYGSMFAAIGAAVDAETDTQQFILPITLPLFFGLLVSQLLKENPESSIGTVLSLIPWTSPVVIMLKSAIWSGDNTWFFVLSFTILAITFLATTWLAAKIYRVGILMYGKKSSYKELWKWLFYKF